MCDFELKSKELVRFFFILSMCYLSSTLITKYNKTNNNNIVTININTTSKGHNNNNVYLLTTMNS